MDFMYGAPDQAYLIASFPNILNPKASIQHLHPTAHPNHLHSRTLLGSMLSKDPVFAVTPLATWDIAILCLPHLSILGPSWLWAGHCHGSLSALATEFDHISLALAGLLIFK